MDKTATVRSKRALTIGICAATLLLGACGSDSGSAGDSDPTTTAVSASTELSITDAWARTSPAGVSNGAIYLKVTSPQADRLVSAQVPAEVAATTEIHETVMSGDAMSEDDMSEDGKGSMTMRPVEGIDLPAGEEVSLEPGGFHIMLLDLDKPLEMGETVEVTLTFETAGEKSVEAEVREG